MKEAGFDFTTMSPDIDESFSPTMPVQQVPIYLAEKKATALLPKATRGEIIIASDTVVILRSEIMNKPTDRADAVRMLSALSGNTHTVITGVCLLSNNKKDVFDDRTEVTFKKLSAAEIDFYIDHYKPFDKAGAYGAQDWLGMVGIEKINGSYFTVMGLPMHKVYEHLHIF
jgi:septum formation protein